MSKGISERLRQQRLAIAETVEQLQGDRTAAARQWKCSKCLVDKACTEFGVQPRQLNLSQHQVVHVVSQLLRTEKTIGQIAEEMGVSYRVIHWITRACKKEKLDIGRNKGRPRKYPEGSREHARRLRLARKRP